MTAHSTSSATPPEPMPTQISDAQTRAINEMQSHCEATLTTLTTLAAKAHA